MADTTTTTATPDTLVATVNADQFKALEDKFKTETDKMAADYKALADKFAAERRARRLDQLKLRADRFVALPRPVIKDVTTDVLAEKMLELEEKAPELYAYFEPMLEAADAAIIAGDLFKQHTRPQAQGSVDDIETLTDTILRDEFKGEQGRYAEAMKVAETRRPDLARKYQLNGGR